MICTATVAREAARRRAVVAVALLVALVACAEGEDEPVPSATVPTAPATTTTTHPYAVPAVIDAVYINRVITGLDAITGDVVRLVVRNRTIPREAFDRLKAQHAYDTIVDRELANYSRELAEGLSGYRSDPGDARTTVKQIITASDSCIYVGVERDYSSVGVRGITARPEWIALWPLDRSRDPYGYNPTGWSYIYEGYTEQRTQPQENPCLA